MIRIYNKATAAKAGDAVKGAEAVKNAVIAAATEGATLDSVKVAAVATASAVAVAQQTGASKVKEAVTTAVAAAASLDSVKAAAVAAAGAVAGYEYWGSETSPISSGVFPYGRVICSKNYPIPPLKKNPSSGGLPTKFKGRLSAGGRTGNVYKLKEFANSIILYKNGSTPTNEKLKLELDKIANSRLVSGSTEDYSEKELNGAVTKGYEIKLWLENEYKPTSLSEEVFNVITIDKDNNGVPLNFRVLDKPEAPNSVVASIAFNDLSETGKNVTNGSTIIQLEIKDPTNTVDGEPVYNKGDDAINLVAIQLEYAKTNSMPSDISSWKKVIDISFIGDTTITAISQFTSNLSSISASKASLFDAAGGVHTFGTQSKTDPRIRDNTPRYYYVKLNSTFLKDFRPTNSSSYHTFRASYKNSSAAKFGGWKTSNPIQIQKPTKPIIKSVKMTDFNKFTVEIQAYGHNNDVIGTSDTFMSVAPTLLAVESATEAAMELLVLYDNLDDLIVKLETYILLGEPLLTAVSGEAGRIETAIEESNRIIEIANESALLAAEEVADINTLFGFNLNDSSLEQAASDAMNSSKRTFEISYEIFTYIKNRGEYIKDTVTATALKVLIEDVFDVAREELIVTNDAMAAIPDITPNNSYGVFLKEINFEVKYSNNPTGTAVAYDSQTPLYSFTMAGATTATGEVTIGINTESLALHNYTFTIPITSPTLPNAHPIIYYFKAKVANNIFQPTGTGAKFSEESDAKSITISTPTIAITPTFSVPTWEDPIGATIGTNNTITASWSLPAATAEKNRGVLFNQLGSDKFLPVLSKYTLQSNYLKYVGKVDSINDRGSAPPTGDTIESSKTDNYYSTETTLKTKNFNFYDSLKKADFLVSKTVAVDLTITPYNQYVDSAGSTTLKNISITATAPDTVTIINPVPENGIISNTGTKNSIVLHWDLSNLKRGLTIDSDPVANTIRKYTLNIDRVSTTNKYLEAVGGIRDTFSTNTENSDDTGDQIGIDDAPDYIEITSDHDSSLLWPTTTYNYSVSATNSLGYTSDEQTGAFTTETPVTPINYSYFNNTLLQKLYTDQTTNLGGDSYNYTNKGVLILSAISSSTRYPTSPELVEITNVNNLVNIPSNTIIHVLNKNNIQQFLDKAAVQSWSSSGVPNNDTQAGFKIVNYASSSPTIEYTIGINKDDLKPTDYNTCSYSGVRAIQTVQFTGTDVSFKLLHGTTHSVDISFDAKQPDVQAAFQGMSTVDSTVTFSPGKNKVSESGNIMTFTFGDDGPHEQLTSTITGVGGSIAHATKVKGGSIFSITRTDRKDIYRVSTSSDTHSRDDKNRGYWFEEKVNYSIKLSDIKNIPSANNNYLYKPLKFELQSYYNTNGDDTTLVKNGTETILYNRYNNTNAPPNLGNIYFDILNSGPVFSKTDAITVINYIPVTINGIPNLAAGGSIQLRYTVNNYSTHYLLKKEVSIVEHSFSYKNSAKEGIINWGSPGSSGGTRNANNWVIDKTITNFPDYSTPLADVYITITANNTVGSTDHIINAANLAPLASGSAPHKVFRFIYDKPSKLNDSQKLHMRKIPIKFSPGAQAPSAVTDGQTIYNVATSAAQYKSEVVNDLQMTLWGGMFYSNKGWRNTVAADDDNSAWAARATSYGLSAPLPPVFTTATTHGDYNWVIFNYPSPATGSSYKYYAVVCDLSYSKYTLVELKADDIVVYFYNADKTINSTSAGSKGNWYWTKISGNNFEIGPAEAALDAINDTGGYNTTNGTGFSTQYGKFAAASGSPRRYILYEVEAEGGKEARLIGGWTRRVTIPTNTSINKFYLAIGVRKTKTTIQISSIKPIVKLKGAIKGIPLQLS